MFLRVWQRRRWCPLDAVQITPYMFPGCRPFVATTCMQRCKDSLGGLRLVLAASQVALRCREDRLVTNRLSLSIF